MTAVMEIVYFAWPLVAMVVVLIGIVAVFDRGQWRRRK